MDGLDAYAVPVAEATGDDRAEFLRMVGLWVFGGILIAYSTGAVSAAMVLMFPVLYNSYVWMAVFWGTFLFSNYACRAMVRSGPKLLGFILGCASEGIALGYLMLMAVSQSIASFGASGVGPFMLVGQAAAVTIVTTVGMTVWLVSGPKELNWIGAGLCVVGPPMLALMAITAAFPITGMLGVGISLLFVAVSAGGLLYNLNQVMHVMNTDQHLEASFEITMGILILFWNVLVTLMRLRD